MENNKTNGDSPAFSKEVFYTDEYNINTPQEGLTKREYFAAMAMQGLLANDKVEHKYCVISAVEYADDLIEQLNKTKTNEK